SAPLGYGKTALVAEWARRDGRPFAWHTLAAPDGPAAFAARLAEAVSCLRPGRAIGDDVRVSPGRPDRTAARLGRVLAALPTPSVIVLDEVENLCDAESIRLVARLVGELPAGSQLVLVSTVEPPLPLARLRARGQLFELGAADLRFGHREAASLVHCA